MKLNELSIDQAAKGLREKKFSAVELTRACLARIDERNTELNAFITVCAEEAVEEAKRADALLAEGRAAPLTGIPFAVKDAICTLGVRSTGAAKILDNYVAPYEATVIKKIRDQGGVLLGKNNCDAFGHGASNENSMYGPVKNPHDLTKVAGGSSGGSAAAVADHMCLFSIAEDTGGSIRYPASLCGVVGLRPSYGRTSRYGAMPMASSLDTVGPITKTVLDSAMVLQVIAGHDPFDATTVADAVPDYAADIKKDIAGLTIGVPQEYFELPGLDDVVRTATLQAIEQLRQAGCTIKNVSLPYTKYAIATYYILVPSEDSSNLARLDGMRYGVHTTTKTLYDWYARSRQMGFPEEVKRRILIGTYALSAGYYDAYYKKAQAVRTLISQDFTNAFSEVDVLITPTAPTVAFGLGEKEHDPLSMYLADIMVSPAALAGITGLSVPAANTRSALPTGVQCLAPRLHESLVFMVGNYLMNSI